MPRWRNQEGVKKKLLKHQNEKNKERDYYNKNIELARRDRKLVEENYIQKQGKVEYCSVDATAHYSWDWAQNVKVPYSSQQVSQEYYLTPRKVHLFGIQNEATRTQINYVLDENEIIGKDPNGTLSPVLNGIMLLNRGEKHLKLNCDNAVGQNKNNITLWFCIYLVICGYYETVELHFMIARHTKFSPDGNFGLIKKLYRKSTIYSIDQFIEVVKKSSPLGLNTVQRYKNGKGFRYLEIKEDLEKYFVKMLNIAKYHHFHFSADNLGVVRVQEFADSPFIEFDLWKDKSKIAESIEEIRELVFHILPPKSLELKRQEYLREKVRPLIPEKYWDITCPRPNIAS